MPEENTPPICHQPKMRTINRGCGATGGGVYGLAFLGAVIYYLQTATSFWDGVLGILKAIVWPAMLVYKLLEFLKM